MISPDLYIRMGDGKKQSSLQNEHSYEVPRTGFLLMVWMAAKMMDLIQFYIY